MTVQHYTRPITKDDKSLKLEALERNQWEAATFELRFPLLHEKANPVNCEFTGSLGAKRLVRFDGRA
jgi:hypothetical protein